MFKVMSVPVPVGGGSGNAFSTDAIAKVTSVSLRSGSRIDCIQIHTTSVNSGVYGGNGGSPQSFSVNGDEVIVAINGRAGSSVDALQFVTNKGSVSPFFGGPGGSSFSFQAPPGTYLVGIQGRCDSKELRAFGPIWGTLSMSVPVPVGGGGGIAFSTDAIARVTSVSLRSSSGIDCIQIHTTSVNSGVYGGNGGSPQSFSVNGDEVIVAINGRAGSSSVDALQFVTNKGSVSPFFGGSGGSSFIFQAPPGTYLVGIQGRKGNVLDAFGPIWGTVAMLPPAPVRVPVPVGGGSGNAFSTDAIAKVTSVSLRSGSRIDCIQIHTTSVNSGVYGGNGGSPQSFSVNGDEVIVAITGRAGPSSVDALEFVTNKGSVSPFFGGTGGSPFSFQAPPGTYLVGIQGRCDTELYAIGPIWGTLP